MHGFGGGYGPGFGMMGGWGGGYGGGFPFGGLFSLLILALVILALVWLVRAILRQRDQGPPAERAITGRDTRGRTMTGLDLLDQRYARGEIGREEYLQKRADVLG